MKIFYSINKFHSFFFYPVMLKWLCIYLVTVRSMFSLTAIQKINLEKDSICLKDTIKILSKINKNYDFDKYQNTTQLLNDFFSDDYQILDLDLSYLDLESIPNPLAMYLKNLQFLDISHNKKLKNNSEWTSLLPKETLKKLSLKKCCLTNDAFDFISKIDSLEDLDISGNMLSKIDNSDSFRRILTKLKHLNISYCGLSGDSFAFICENGINLESLNFSGNSLNAHIENKDNKPICIGYNMKSLVLSNCFLKSHHLKNILIRKNLIEINLSENDFSEIDDSLIKMLFQSSLLIYDGTKSSKEPLDASIPQCCQSVNHEMPMTFDSTLYRLSFCNLKSINLRNCDIKSSSFIENLFNITNLKALNLSENDISKSLEKLMICSAKNTIEKLEISNCSIERVRIFKILSEFPHLTFLDVSENNFRFNFDRDFSLGNLENTLTHLNIDNCHFNIYGLCAIFNCAPLVYLSASDNCFSLLQGRIDFKKLTNLEEVYINNSILSPYVLIEFMKCNSLRKLNVSNNNLNELKFIQTDNSLLENLSKSLEELHINRCYLTQQSLNLITNFPNLKYLYASSNNFEIFDINSAVLGCSKYSLELIIMDKSKLNDYSLKYLTGCVKLKKLVVSRNAFGLKSIDFGCAKESLKEIDLSWSNLNGCLFNAITECSKLETLVAISSNLLILDEDFELKKLENSLKRIDFSNSTLSVEFIEAFSKCGEIEVLNISNSVFDDKSKLKYVLIAFRNQFKSNLRLINT